MRSSTRAFRLLAIAALGLSAWWVSVAQAADQPGLRATAESLPWPRLAARVGFQMGPVTLSPTLRPDALGDTAFEHVATPLQAVNLLGDIYFSATSRFRATGGMLLGMRALPWPSPVAAGGTLTVGGRVSLTPGETATEAADSVGTVPYLGIGYSDAYDRGRWGFSADVGLLAMASQPAVRLGRMFSGQQGFDDLIRDLRLTPSVQVGVSYAF